MGTILYFPSHPTQHWRFPSRTHKLPSCNRLQGPQLLFAFLPSSVHFLVWPRPACSGTPPLASRQGTNPHLSVPPFQCFRVLSEVAPHAGHTLASCPACRQLIGCLTFLSRMHTFFLLIWQFMHPVSSTELRLLGHLLPQAEETIQTHFWVLSKSIRKPRMCPGPGPHSGALRWL